ncbi:c-type cytochrome [Sulfurimonas sp. HSL-1656]|uniref:c-type cytochrome n=1 Tax=Thiomicrolovo subterrani TaxID=3131934 RepID=UPI0031F7E0E6
MTKLVTALVVTFGLTCSLSADGAAAYKKCSACHGTTGEKSALGKSKVINTMTKAEIVTALSGYKDGSYGGPMKAMMKGQVASLSEADIQSIADMVGK